MITVINEQIRSKLSEGRNYGLGFSILEKLSPKKFQTYLPYTACKDYLNDFSYIEFEKREIGSVHGYHHKLIDKFDRVHYFYLGVKAVNYNDGKDWDKREEAENQLITNYKVLEKILNDFEALAGIKTRSSITVLDDKSIIIKAPLYWLKKTWLISVMTLIIRCYFNVEENVYKTLEDLVKSKQLVNGKHLPFIGGDKMYLKNIEWFYDNMDEIVYDKLPYVPLIGSKPACYTVHNFGIQGLRKKWKPEASTTKK